MVEFESKAHVHAAARTLLEHSTLKPIPIRTTMTEGAVLQPNATLYVSNIDWKIKKPLLTRALYSLFSRHGKVRPRGWILRIAYNFIAPVCSVTDVPILVSLYSFYSQCFLLPVDSGNHYIEKRRTERTGMGCLWRCSIGHSGPPRRTGRFVLSEGSQRGVCTRKERSYCQTWRNICQA